MKIAFMIALGASTLMPVACVTETYMIENSTWRTCNTRCGKKELKYLGYRVTYSYVYFQSSVQDIICECFGSYRYMLAPKGKYNNDWEDE